MWLLNQDLAILLLAWVRLAVDLEEARDAEEGSVKDEV